MIMNGLRVVYLIIIISASIFLAASAVLVTLHGIGDSALLKPKII
jgi:hypothetical protein